MLAGSPLLAMAYPGLSPAWQREVDRVLARDQSASGRATRMVCADCGQAFQLPAMRPMRSSMPQAGAPQSPTPNALDVHLTGQLIDAPGDAINVWDFEAVAHANTLPQHWNYIHMACKAKIRRLITTTRV